MFLRESNRPVCGGRDSVLIVLIAIGEIGNESVCDF